MYKFTRIDLIIIVLVSSSFLVTSEGAQVKCDQTPRQSTVKRPSENNGLYHLNIESKEPGKYLPSQTYVLKLTSDNDTRPFRWFMITVEDPDVDNATDQYLYQKNIDVGTLKTLDTDIAIIKLTSDNDTRPFRWFMITVEDPDVDNATDQYLYQKNIDVGTLKTLDTDKQTRYSDLCANTVENSDSSDKTEIEVHWISPRDVPGTNEQKVRLRAMVAENDEVWYVKEHLTIVLEKNLDKPPDSPPLQARAKCNLCSEAQYEVIFRGKWSRVTHPQKYPSKPDENGYSHMIGASHSYNHVIWKQGQNASSGMRMLAERADELVLQREIIDAISETGGTRTLIIGPKNHHPYMFEESRSLFRVDRFHHLFSLAVAMRPSPDWFLGTSQFELCKDDEWLDFAQIPLYPWDAGTMDGISYESPTTITQPLSNIQRVAVGSFDRNSPFYQKNLNDLKPFAELTVKRLNVFPYVDVDCSASVEETNYGENVAYEEMEVLKDEDNPDQCGVAWAPWSPCVAYQGTSGFAVRVRGLSVEESETNLQENNCQDELQNMEIKECSVNEDVD